MIDIKFLRENPDAVKENIRKKFQDEKVELVDEVIKLDEERRATQQEADDTHRHQFGECSHTYRSTHFLQLLETELQADTEQHEHHTDFAPGLHAGVVADNREPLEIRSDEETCDNIA